MHSLVVGQFEGYGLQPVHKQRKMIESFNPGGKHLLISPPTGARLAAQISRPETESTESLHPIQVYANLDRSTPD